MSKNFIFAALVAWSTSCATMSNNKTVVGIDSSPRGALVYADPIGRSEIGRTPLIHYHLGSDISIFTKNGNKLYETKEECRLKPLGFWVGNSAIGIIMSTIFGGPVGVAVGLGGMAYDAFISKAGYDCPDVFIAPKNVAPPSTLPCVNMIMLPPEHFDEAVSDFVAETWANFKPEGRRCVAFAPFEETNDLFAYLGARHSEPFDIESTGWQKLRELAATYKASHVLQLKVEDTTGKLVVTPKVYDLIGLTTDSDYFKKIRQLSGGPAAKILISNAKSKKTLIKSLNFIPNSITLSARGYTLSKDEELGYEITNERAIPTLPSILSSWGVGVVDHPRAYDSFDFVLSGNPTIDAGFVLEEYTVGLESVPPESRETERAKFGFLTLMLEGAIIGHTPFGAFGLGIGMGIGMFYTDSVIEEVYQLARVTDIFAKYTAFITDNSYFFISITQYYADATRKEAPIRSQHFVVRDWSTVSIGLGYYFPRIKSYVRKIL